MLFIDQNDLSIENSEGYVRKNRRVICDICSVMGDKFYIHKQLMDFDAIGNVYSCPQCGEKISGKVVESKIYFKDKRFLYNEPEKIKQEQSLVIEFGGLDENDKAPDIDITNLDSESEEPQ
jgi:hypothetical protein